MYSVDPTSPRFMRILSQNWYYSVELKPGVFTHGGNYENIICTRELLRRLNPAGLDACDIGTMEAMVPVLLKRRGARSVVAMDAVDLTERVNLVQQCYGESFEYCPKVPLYHTKEFLTDRSNLSRYWGQVEMDKGFDIVVLSGVLYHVFSPMHVLGLARTLLKKGGILFLETAASSQDRYSLNWDFRGDHWIYGGGTNTWFITLKLLDHFLRYMKFKVIDCVHGPLNEDITRVAVAAIAVADPLPLKAESQWFMASTNNLDYNEVVDTVWSSGKAGGIPYSAGDNIFHSELPGTVDLHKTVTKRKHLPLDRDKIIFHLIDKE